MPPGRNLHGPVERFTTTSRRQSGRSAPPLSGHRQDFPPESRFGPSPLRPIDGGRFIALQHDPFVHTADRIARRAHRLSGRRPCCNEARGSPIRGRRGWHLYAWARPPRTAGLRVLLPQVGLRGERRAASLRLTPGVDDPGNDGHGGAAAGQDRLVRYVELRRHTDNQGDRLTPQGTADAEMIGRGGLDPPMPRSSPLARRAPPRCWRFCGVRPARMRDRSPRRRGCGHRLRIAGGRRPGRRGRARTWMPCGRSTRTWSSENPCCSARAARAQLATYLQAGAAELQWLRDLLAQRNGRQAADVR
jgi:hypothetical protein